jgi:hypothetical protein
MTNIPEIGKRYKLKNNNNIKSIILNGKTKVLEIIEKGHELPYIVFESYSIKGNITIIDSTELRLDKFLDLFEEIPDQKPQVEDDCPNEQAAANWNMEQEDIVEDKKELDQCIKELKEVLKTECITIDDLNICFDELHEKAQNLVNALEKLEK